MLQVIADPPAARFPGCGKRANLTATVSDATVSGSISFYLVDPRLDDFLSGKSSSRQLGEATLSGGTGAHTLRQSNSQSLLIAPFAAT